MKRPRRKKGEAPRSPFEADRDELGWSSRYLAQKLGIAPDIVERWAVNGTAPPQIMAWMGGLLAYQRAFPPPAGWQNRPEKRAKRQSAVSSRGLRGKMPAFGQKQPR
jgi:hypothetical protein